MDALILILVILFWLFTGLGIRHWYVYNKEKKQLVTHLVETTNTFGFRKKKRETMLGKLIKKISKYADDYADIGQRINFFSEPDEIENLLRKANYPLDLTLERFQGLKIFLAITGFFLGVLCIVIGLPFSQYGIIFFPLIGYIGSILLLKSKAKARQDELKYDLPDFLDTVSVSLQAGVGLDQTLHEVVKYFDGPLKEEFSRFNHEINLGVPREEAYRSLLKRNDSPEFQTLIKSLIQGMKLGVPIATTFKTQAEDMRVMRKELVKEKAAKASPKITLITSFIITPAAIMMIAGLMILNLIYGDNSILNIFD